MSPATRVRAKQKLHAVADKIGYPDHWRDYSKLTISPTDALGNAERANRLRERSPAQQDRQARRQAEWGMTPPTVNAYYNPSMNDINFPAGILQPAFYDPNADLAVNYGHIGAVIGHELTHGFDDEGKKFDAKAISADWWTADDTKKFEAKHRLPRQQYGSFTAVEDPKDAVKVNGKLTLGENTADNGGLVLAYMAYLDRAKKDGIDITRRSTATPARSASTSPSRRTGAKTPAPKPSASRSSPTPTPPTTSAPTEPSSTSPASPPPSAARRAPPWSQPQLPRLVVGR
jgi:putative endopeptidase